MEYRNDQHEHCNFDLRDGKSIISLDTNPMPLGFFKMPLFRMLLFFPLFLMDFLGVFRKVNIEFFFLARSSAGEEQHTLALLET